jgi:hypothetical protein
VDFCLCFFFRSIRRRFVEFPWMPFSYFILPYFSFDLMRHVSRNFYATGSRNWLLFLSLFFYLMGKLS